MKQAIAPLGEVDRAALAEDVGPLLVDDLQLGERLFPMPRELARLADRVAKLRWRHLFDQQSVERPGKIGSKPKCLCRSFRTDDPREPKSPLGGIDGGRHGAAVDGLQRSADPLVDIRIADRDEPRQQQAGAAGAHERVGHRPYRAIIGKQDSPAGKLERIAPEFLDQSRRQGIRERPVGRNRVD